MKETINFLTLLLLTPSKICLIHKNSSLCSRWILCWTLTVINKGPVLVLEGSSWKTRRQSGYNACHISCDRGREIRQRRDFM